MRIQKDSQWDCGDWGICKVIFTTRGKRPTVNLTVVKGNIANNTVRGDRVVLLRESFENGIYAKVG